MRGPGDEDGKTETEREKERERRSGEGSVMKRREERIKKRLTGLRRNTGGEGGCEIEMEKHGGVETWKR